VIHPAVADAIRGFDAVIIGPGSFYTSIMPPLLVSGVVEALASVRGPIILIANLLTEGRGMAGFTAATAVQQLSAAIDRHVDVAIVNTRRPPDAVLAKYEGEHKAMLPHRRRAGVVRGHRGRPLAPGDRAARPLAPGLRRVERAFEAPVVASGDAALRAEGPAKP
jgi:uncharacterized cofD-like protein